MSDRTLVVFVKEPRPGAVKTRLAAALGRADVRAAFAELATHDVVLGPAHDGGYYLVALRAPQPSLFDGVAWSRSSVLDETLARAAATGLSVARLRPLRDVDTLDDLRAEWPALAPLLRRQPALRDRIASRPGPRGGM